MIVEISSLYGTVFLCRYIVGGASLKRFRHLFCLSWGMVLVAIGGGILLALSVPASIIVILLSVLLILVGCLLSHCDHHRKF